MLSRFCLIILVFCFIAVSAGNCLGGNSESRTELRHTMLIYLEAMKHKRFSSPEDFRPFAAYLDKKQNGKAQDWFFENYCILQYGGAPSGGCYFDGNCKKDDWVAFLDQLFVNPASLSNLQKCLDSLSQEMDRPKHSVNITIMVPYLGRTGTEFGDVDGDGKPESNVSAKDRMKIYQWYIGEFLKRWETSSYKRLNLWGFYWIKEGIIHADDADEVKSVSSFLDKKGYGLHWIPWYVAPGYKNWKELGFSQCDMQPNFAMKQPLEGAVLPNEDRLTENANLCREYGLKVEMEVINRAAPTRNWNAWMYMNHGCPELDGYMLKDLGGWYQDHRIVARKYESSDPENNLLYDDFYKFVKGTYKRRIISVHNDATVSVDGKAIPQLNDTLWLTRGERLDRLGRFAGNTVFDIDLQRLSVVGDLRIHLAGNEKAKLSLPDGIQVLTSKDGTSFREVEVKYKPELLSKNGWKFGFACLNWQPELARYLKVKLVAGTEAKVGVDEIRFFPPATITWGQTPKRKGALAKDCVPVSIYALLDGKTSDLSDGRYSVSFASGNGSIEVPLLEENVPVSEICVHASKITGKAGSCKAVLKLGDEVTWKSDAKPFASAMDGWLVFSVPAAKADSVTVEFVNSAETFCDEIFVKNIQSKSRGKPYSFSPSFPEVIGDPECEKLIDGKVAGNPNKTGVLWKKGDPLELVFSLKEQKSIDKVVLSSYRGNVGDFNIEEPDWLGVELSEDGESWSCVFSAIPEKQNSSKGWSRFSSTFSPANAGFVRLRIGRRSSWLMLGEVQISGNGKIAPDGSRYYSRPVSHNTDLYGDVRGALTDGKYVQPFAYVGGWGTVAGWSKGKPEVVIDLLKETEINAAAVHCLGGGARFHGGDKGNGCFLPGKVEVLTSSDGKDWTLVGSASPQNPAQEIRKGWPQRKFLNVNFAKTTGRFVKFRMQHRKGWMIVDEVEVY